MTDYTLVATDGSEVYIEADRMTVDGNWIIFSSYGNTEYARYQADLHTAVITGPRHPIAWRGPDEIDNRVQVEVPRSDIETARLLRSLIQHRQGDVPTWVDDLADKAEA